ncbi:Uncharacterised protein [uncultured archaeon]|nr:Uncharacterised protein [uncultured archaeon]
MAGLENSMDLAAEAKKTKKPAVDRTERERQRAFLEQLRSGKTKKVKASKASRPHKTKARSKKGKKMTRAKEDETYYCEVCGCEVTCIAGSESPLICCDEEMCVIA